MALHSEETQEPGQFFTKIHTSLLIYPMRRHGTELGEPEVRTRRGALRLGHATPGPR